MAAAPDESPILNSHKPLHIVMFPWLAFGHIIPFLQLSKLVALKGHKISFITTPRNLHRIPQFASPHPSISFVPVSLPTVPGLPPNAEATADIHGADQMALLKKACDGLEPAVVRFLQESSPDWVIMDFMPHWLPPHAARLGISTGFFFILNAWSLAFFGPARDLVSGSDYRTRPEDFMVPPKWVKFDTTLAYRRHEANWMVGTGQSGASGFSDAYRVGKVILGCDAIFIRHCREFQPNWLPLLEEIDQRPVVPLGLMPPNLEDNNKNPNFDEAEEKAHAWASIENWLDRRDKNSVVYVALGSEVTPSSDQIIELAHGLELSGVPFFMVLRNPDSVAALPAGLEERVGERGMVWKNWAPQLKILSHESVGCFLTHCGWSSIVESLMYGHPMITLPFLVDQGLNSRIVEEEGVAVEVPRNDDGSYRRERVAEQVRRVMVEEEGTALRETAKEAMKLFRNRELHNGYSDDFVDYLQQHTNDAKQLPLP